jgi:Holliday junction resolvase RusA-like endonuclease
LPMPLIPPHPLDVALGNLRDDVPTSERIEVIWQYYETQTGNALDRPPSETERQAVHDWLLGLRTDDNFPVFWTRRPRLRLEASLSILEKAASVAQLACPACKPLLGWSGLPVPVEPWSAQVSNDENQRMKQLVREYLGNRSHFRGLHAGPLCVSVVTVLPRSRKPIDADNAVKGLLDSLAKSVYENDRDIQCLTSRVMRNANESGHYILRIAPVEPWEEDVVWPNNPAQQMFA